LAAHARGTTLGPDTDLDQVAAATPGFSGADLAGLVNEAAVTAVRAGRTTVTAADFREYGLSDNLGPVSYTGPPAGHPASGAPRGYSEHTQWLVDQEVAALLTKAETRARDLLTTHRQALDQLTAALLEQETVTGDQVRALAHAPSPAPLTDGQPASPRPVAGHEHAAEPPLSTNRISR
jgi:ATP-dependent Zn protease